MRVLRSLFVLFPVMLMAIPVSGQAFNGTADNQRDDLDYYYVLTGGKFVNGQTRNGDNASGGTMRFILDDPSWGYPTGSWQKDDWFPQNASVAMTFINGSTTVYDNNGILDGTEGDFYNAMAQGTANSATPGLYRGYSMYNNYDWTYAGYFQTLEELTFNTLVGFFDGTGYYNDGTFNPANFAYQMNIWSETDGMLPTNTGSFNGDVFSTTSGSGTFTYGYTGVDRVFSDGSKDPIWYLKYVSDKSITLGPGGYYFNNAAGIPEEVVPEPATMSLLAMGLAGLGGANLKRRKKRA